MLKVIVIEGARGTGKSTVARLLRESIWGSTLINLTGFSDDGEEGLDKIVGYYAAMTRYLDFLQGCKYEYTLIFDRTFFSEMVYSPLFKSYDFKPMYEFLCEDLLYAANVEIYFLTVSDRKELKNRLNRDKVELFDAVEETVENSMIQQKQYEALFDEFIDNFGDRQNLKLFKIDTTEMTPDEIKQSILKE